MKSALLAWQKIIGPEHILTDQVNLAPFAQATFPTSQNIPAVIRPGSVSEIQDCLRIANQYKVPIYPVSCGKNWGLGSKVPVLDGCVVMELNRLDGILDYNEKLAYITVEPGVTFQQVYEYLQNVSSPLFLSVIGGSPYSSLIGNALERGDGNGPYGDRLAHACNLEVVLPSGDCVHPGLGRFPQVKTSSVNRWGVGPYLDGMFSQSNLGIVTKMTFWLKPKPNYYQHFQCQVNEEQSLRVLVDQVQSLMLKGLILENCFSLWNSYKMLAKKGRYPWQLMKQKTPLDLKQIKGVEPWFGFGEIYAATSEQGLLLKQLIEQNLAGEENTVSFAEPHLSNYPYEIPKTENIKSTYWRKKTKVPEDVNPDRDNCGVIWLCPVLPFDGQEVVRAVQIAESILKSCQFEPNLAIQCISARNVYLYVAIIYDREVKGEDQKAIDCHDRLLSKLSDNGYIPYRLGIQSMNSLPEVQDDYNQLLRILKHSLDPKDILAPGRYDFRHNWLDST
jgi:4-cresol dehydrogenase (hydroxylating)